MLSAGRGGVNPPLHRAKISVRRQNVLNRRPAALDGGVPRPTPAAPSGPQRTLSQIRIRGSRIRSVPRLYCAVHPPSITMSVPVMKPTDVKSARQRLVIEPQHRCSSAHDKTKSQTYPTAPRYLAFTATLTEFNKPSLPSSASSIVLRKTPSP